MFLHGRRNTSGTDIVSRMGIPAVFNDLGKNPSIIYAADQEASGKMKVGFLGGQPENYAEWPEVYSADGGRYQMTVHYSFGKGRQLEVDVNGAS